MQTPASIARHPIHPMLVPIPIGLWIFSFVCDLFHAGGASAEAWTTVAFYTMAGGIIGALLAALPGLIDLLSLPEGPRATAIKHMALNLTIVALYIINFAMRWKEPANPGGLVWLSLISLVLLVISGWLGGKMVYEYGVAVATTTEPPRR
ncbi:MAG: DUF2231 domain-containing protein [Betaproteobacteria bacterium]|nr:MAG: DUF2231 domain-containing protein [Betaproteobacteria bacterium]